MVSLKLQAMEKLIRKGNKVTPKESENLITSCLNNKETNLSTHQHQHSVWKCKNESANKEKCKLQTLKTEIIN